MTRCSCGGTNPVCFRCNGTGHYEGCSAVQRKEIGRIWGTLNLATKALRSEEAFLLKLAKAEVFSTQKPEPPTAFLANIAQFGDVAAWLHADPRRKSRYDQLLAEQQKIRKRALPGHLAACVRASKNGLLTEENPFPPRKLKHEVQQAGGNIRWLVNDEKNLQAYREKGGDTAALLSFIQMLSSF